MDNEITNTVATETQTTPVAEENTQATDPQVDGQEGVNQQVENSNGEETENNVVDTTQQINTVVEPTTEELKAKLKEYEVKAEEEKLLRESLGLSDVDSQTYNYMNIEQQVINEGKHEYLRLCTEYGIDANPEKLDASINLLKEKDPAKGYEFLHKLERLHDAVGSKRQYVQQQVSNYEIGKFQSEYNDLLNVSPALNNIVASYVNNFAGNGNIYGQLHNVMDIVLPAYQEAFEAGKRFALGDKAKTDKSAVTGGIATNPTATAYAGGDTFTREQIAKMSTEEFTKHEATIRRLMMEGKL